MTLHATREGQRITINSSFGIGDVHHKYEITEDAQHVRYFWHQLGEHLNAADAEREQPAADAT